MVLIAVFQVCIFFLERLEVVASSLKFLLEPLYTMLQLFDIFWLVVCTILHCRWADRRALVSSPYRIVSGSSLICLANTTLISRITSSYFLPNLLENFLWEFWGHLVLEDWNFLDHHLRILNLTFLQFTQNWLELFTHHIVLLEQVRIWFFQRRIFHNNIRNFTIF